jgi:hypothetical protein
MYGTEDCSIMERNGDEGRCMRGDGRILIF